MDINIPIAKEHYYKAVLKMLDILGNTQLSKLEMDIILVMLERKITVVDTNCREVIRKVLNKDKFVTNNYIKKLRTKNILVTRPNDRKYYLQPELLKAVYDAKLSVTLQPV